MWLIGALSQHVGFRASVLTTLLRESLQGNAKTFLIGAMSQAASAYEETIATLSFLAACKRVVTAPKINRVRRATSNKKIQHCVCFFSPYEPDIFISGR